MNRRWLGCLLGFFCVTTVGYTVSIVAATPEEMIRRPFSCPTSLNTEAQNFQVLTVRKWAQGMVALYRGQCPTSPKAGNQGDTSLLSYRVVKRNGMEWDLSSSGSYPSRNSQKSKESSEKNLIEYSVGRNSSKAKEQHAVFYGEVLSPTVAAVEVTFNNGKVLRDTGLDGMLLLVASDATGVCDVRVLGVDNQILQRDELAASSPLTPESAVNVEGNTCQPISGQL